MTQAELKENFSEMIAGNPPLKKIEELFFKAVNSGALNYEDEEQNSYRIAMIIYHAILYTMAKDWMPLVKENIEEAENLKKFL
ncbi:hypothetical protein DBR39_12680 [Chryseobacterium sp. KBW03]|uniref:hypothetical protein n=1 Tax=Bacteroidota TaxID=976 RepID=UPI000F5B0860|nr:MULTISPECIES: hypothetical protein [Bacteroidota]RQO37739.1 hypothetical protein DBR39_12680 [Chryseobacterium sp. KBW03]